MTTDTLSANRPASIEAIPAIARALAEAFAPGAASRDAAREVPFEELGAIARSGLLGVNVPQAFGGLGAPPSVVVEIIRTLATADPSIAQTLQTHYSNVDRLALFGTPELSAFFFPRLLAGQRFGNASTERGGATAGVNTCRLHRLADGTARLHGRKYYTTGALTCDWIVVRAMDDEDRVVNVFVDRHAQGVSVINDWTAMGQRGTASGTATFDNVIVPQFLVQDNPYDDARSEANKILTFLIHAAVQAGIAGGALDEGVAFLRDRARPHPEVASEGGMTRVSEDVHVQIEVGKLVARRHAAEALLLRAAGLLDALRKGGDVLEDRVDEARIAMAEAKAFATDIAIQISSAIFEFAGSSGADEAVNLNRHWRNSRTHSLHDSTSWKYRQAGRFALLGKGPEWSVFYHRLGEKTDA